MRKFSSFFLTAIVILGLVACTNGVSTNDIASESSESNDSEIQPDENSLAETNPTTELQANAPAAQNNPSSETPLNADTYQAGKFTVTVDTDPQRGKIYRGCDGEGNCVELENGTSWRDRGNRGISWENGDYTYAISWQEGTTGPMYLNVYNNDRRLLREPMVPISNRDRATTVAISDTERGEVLEYFSNNRAALNLCEPTLDPQYSQQSSEVYPVGEGKYLVKLSCFLAAYQEGFEFWLYEKTAGGVDVQPLTLTRFNAANGGKPNPDEIRTLGGTTSYDTANKAVTIFTKFRGVGDCGSLARYKFENNSLDLVSYKAKYDCDGNYVDPEQYPQIYP